jgi:hypothetical protein
MIDEYERIVEKLAEWKRKYPCDERDANDLLSAEDFLRFCHNEPPVVTVATGRGVKPAANDFGDGIFEPGEIQ